MRADRQPDCDFARDFKTIAGAKRVARRRWLEAAEPHVLDRYDDFQLATDRLEVLPRLKWRDGPREALRHCYDGGGKGLKALRSSFIKGIGEVARRRCPYCMTRPPGSIDHFLPLDHYPEFAVLVTNWVYACERCNRIKGADLVEAERSIVNPYFDGVSEDEPLLYARASVTAGTVTIEFSVPTPNPLLPRPELAEIAARQVEALGVLDDMRDEAVPFLTSTLNVIVDEAPATLTAAELATRLQARRRNVPFAGVNAWERTALEALERCPGLVALVNDRIAARPVPTPLPPPRDPDLVLRAARIAAGL